MRRPTHTMPNFRGPGSISLQPVSVDPTPGPGDELYLDCPLSPLLAMERQMLLMMRPPPPREHLFAFTIANKADLLLNTDKWAEADKMAFRAIASDPSVIDSFRVLARHLHPFTDGDTVISNLREIMYLSRFDLRSLFLLDTDFYPQHLISPYLRLLSYTALVAIAADQLELATFAFEEHLRLNHLDNFASRDMLLACYIALIGRKRRNAPVSAIRTFDQADRFIKTPLSKRLSEPPLNKDDVIVRWYNIVRAYAKNGDWRSLARQEGQRSATLVKILFREIDAAPATEPEARPKGHRDDPRKVDGALKMALLEWPDLMIDLHTLLRKPDDAFDTRMRAMVPIHCQRESQELMRQMGETFLDKGRAALQAKNYEDAVKYFSIAKRGYVDYCLPSHRWYTIAPFALVSNRATAAQQLGYWNLARIDTRFTLLMKPDHRRSYERLPAIAAAFGATVLKREFEELLAKIQKDPPKSDDGWKSLARLANGMLSVASISLTMSPTCDRDGKYPFPEIGADDLFLPINVSSKVHSLLPHLRECDLEHDL
jgi:tetratricopeptide (TPR) repeat protein